MDGNGRWAVEQGLPRAAGHAEGVSRVRDMTRLCRKAGVEVLTLYAFSTENWRRPQDEVDSLMAMLMHFLAAEREELLENQVRVAHCGEVWRLPPSVQDELRALEEATADCEGMVLNLALSYGARQEIARGAKRLAEQVAAGAMQAEDINAEALAAELDTAGLPDPDLIVRTGGEQRLSNFLLWQAAYAEMYTTSCYWPEFGQEELNKAFAAFAVRQRRFGLTGGQVAAGEATELPSQPTLHAPAPAPSQASTPSAPSGTKVRFISGGIAFLLVLPILCWGSLEAVAGLVLFAACIGLWEMAEMGLPDRPRGTLPLLLGLGVPVFLSAAASTAGDATPAWLAAFHGPFVATGVWVSAVVLSSIWFVFTAKDTQALADRWARFLLALLYVPLLFGLLVSLFNLPGGRGWLWLPLFAAWCSDIGGYFAGRAFGKHPLFPLISPKKTREGMLGGLVLAVAGLCIFKYGFFDPYVASERGLDLLDCVVLGTLGSGVSVVGDLIESMIKRSYGAKDSGKILPGHGGILDRMDAVMFATVAVYLWVVFLRPELGG